MSRFASTSTLLLFYFFCFFFFFFNICDFLGSGADENRQFCLVLTFKRHRSEETEIINRSLIIFYVNRWKERICCKWMQKSIGILYVLDHSFYFHWLLISRWLLKTYPCLGEYTQRFFFFFFFFFLSVVSYLNGATMNDEINGHPKVLTLFSGFLIHLIFSVKVNVF